MNLTEGGLKKFLLTSTKKYIMIAGLSLFMEEHPASLLTYSTRRKKFDSVYERNKFYRGLFGYKQTVKRNGKTYEYDKDGLMDEVPNARIDDSVFIIKKSYDSQVKDYFADWGDKVSYHLLKVIVDDKELIEKLNQGEIA